MKHKYTHSAEQPNCEMESSVGLSGIAALTRTIFGTIDCEDCLRQAIAESEERTRILRELLGKAEALS